MQCKNHTDRAAVDRCAGCAETFCANCLVPVSGQKFCASCKVMNVKNMPMAVELTKPCAEASEAFKYAAIGIVLFGFILGPMAVLKGLAARKMIAENRQLTGSGKANAAIIGGLFIAVMSIYLFTKNHS